MLALAGEHTSVPSTWATWCATCTASSPATSQRRQDRPNAYLLTEQGTKPTEQESADTDPDAAH
jgi:hypothetical protein